MAIFNRSRQQPVSLGLFCTLQHGILSISSPRRSLVFIGIGLGWWFYGRKPIESAESRMNWESCSHLPLPFGGHAFFVDALYSATILP